ncbi:MAG TPA: putative porin [Chitinophagaceae bacterium]
MRFRHLQLLLLTFAVLETLPVVSQRTITRDPQQPPAVTTDGRGRPVNPNRSKTDSLRRRDPSEDSITIYFRYFDSTRIRSLDSSINDFSKRFPLPYYYVHNGNPGNAARSYLFTPPMRAGFDVGFHAFDVYRFKIEDTRIFQTTRPYTELGYLLGSKAEQMIHILHTQNKGSNLNFGFEYRFLNTPGILRNQNASHNNFRFHTYFNSNNRRYTAYIIYQNNHFRSSENGGVINENDLKELSFNDPFQLNTRLGNNNQFTRSPFNTSIVTGNDYKDNTFLVRQQYDLGQKDSLVTDSATYRLFYPRLRLQHTFRYIKQRFLFKDYNPDTTGISYKDYLQYANKDTLEFADSWQEFNNEFSILSFPQKNNVAQFLKLGIALQNLRGRFSDTEHLHNFYALAEYRNRSRNQAWDILASGQLYLNGFNSGDYAAQISLKRSLGRKLGFLELGFQNVNRTPSVIFFGKTSFPVRKNTGFDKENHTRLFGSYDNPKIAFRLSAEYFIASNYSYFDSFYHAKQERTIFNFLHLAAEKRFVLAKNIHLYTELHLQQATGNPPVHVPLLFTRNRLAYEGKLGLKNLDLAAGVEMRYHTPYKADNYSPLNGQFVFQDTVTISNRPELNLFVDFRIKTFKAFIRLENINASGNKMNLVSSHYLYMPMWFRVGIWWGFVN